MSAVKLPRALEDKLADLAAGVRRLWLLRGVCWFALVLVASGLLAVLLDAKYDLPGWGRGLLLAGWLAGLVATAWRCVGRPLRSPVPVPLLAAAIEAQFPSLSERLSTLVELSEQADDGNGSQALIAVLAKDTAQRTRRLNFYKAAPTGSAVRAGFLAAGVALVALSPLVLVPGAAERVRRFLLPWYVPTVEVPFRVVVSSGDPIVKRGEAVTLTAVLERTRPDAALPEAAVLIYREPGSGQEKKLPMAGDEKAAFHVTRPDVRADFEYRVEAGPAASGWHAVTVVDPVELAEGTTFTIDPPEYARPAFPRQTYPGLHEFEAIQFSKITFDLKLSRPAVSAYFEWKPANPNAVVETDRFTATLSPEKTAGRVDWLLLADGNLKLVLVGEKNVRTEISVATRATVDTPPKFEKVTNVSDKPREVRPDERLVLDLAVADDIKVDKVQVEYALDGAEQFKVVPVPLKGVGTPRADGRFAFELADKAKEGQTVRFRVRAFDNRSVPEFGKQPQEAVFPEKEWSVLKLTTAAQPLLEQDVFGKRDKIKEKLQELTGALADAQRQVEGVKREAVGKPELAAADIARLENARSRAKDVARELDDLAREAGLTPELRPLAAGIKAVAEDQLRTADDELRKAGNEAEVDARDKAIAAAAKNLEEAIAKLADLIGKNEQAARNRLDRDRLERLAAEERKLAEEAKQKADDPKAAADIARRQQEIRDELRELLNKNEALRKAVEQTAQDEARKLADEAKRLADAQKELDRAGKDLDAAARQKAMEQVARRQKELAEQAAELGKRTDGPAKLADAEPLNRDPFEQAGDRLNKGDAVGALTEQEKAARELDRLAAALERAVAARNDPREAAKQLAKLEDELRKRLAEATKEKPFDQLPEALQMQMRAEQEAVRRAAEKLSPPPADELAKKAKQDAIDKLEKARDGLSDEAMQQAADALRRLAEKLPPREQRLRQAREELEKLQREQDALQREIEEKAKGLDRKTPDAATRKEAAEKLADAAKKQAAIAEKLAGLDAPGLERRRERAAEAARQAADDLAKGRPQDIPASQQEARRQADRLRQALDGQTPADELADQLARKERQVADAAEKANGKPDRNQLQDLQEFQREINQQLGGLKDPGAAERLNRAKEAARAAEEALKKPDADELRKKTKDAAAELDRLADELAGTESDADRAGRLAKERQEAANKAQKAAGKPANPDESAAARDALDRQADDLRRTRAGEAQEAKKKAADALDRLRKTPNPDRAPTLQKQAAEAMKDLANQMKGNGDRTAKNERGSPNGEQPDDAGGQLPSKADADAARQMARQQRDARDQLAKANEQAAKGTPPTDNAGIEKLAREQQQIAEQAGELAKQAGQDGAGGREAGQAADAARQAANGLKAGAMERAKDSGEKTQQQLEAAAKQAGDTAAGRTAKELAGKQAGLNKRIGEAAGDPGAATAQQQARQGELAKQAGDLSEKLDKAARDEAMKKAADAAREARQQMDRAAREDAAGRKPNAADARDKAAAAMDRAQQQAKAAAGEAPKDGKPDPSAAAAGLALQDADRGMQQAGKQLGQKDGPEATKSMEKAADQLDKAAEKLAQSGDGPPGQPGQPGQGGGPQPGGNDGSAKGAVTTDIPPDLAKYLGTPWGDLPGDVKSKIIQDLQAKYGEDYARVIKLYFEQIAERK